MEVNQIVNGDCIEVMKSYPDNTFDAVICDPPYGLEFMGKEWDKFTGSDTGIIAQTTSTYQDKGFDKLPIFRGYSEEQRNAFRRFSFEWSKEALRILKPGGHLLAFGGSRTYHNLACGIEDAGFEIRDQIMWIYGSGFPKSMNIGKAIDKMQGNEREVIGERKAYDIRGNALMEATVPEYKKEKSTFNYQFTKGNTEWEGWGTALKPAHEPIVVARKPISEKSIALNVLKWNTGGINIDDCRIPSGTEHMRGNVGAKVEETDWKNNSGLGKPFVATDSPLGRFPANIILECTCDELKVGKIEGAIGHFPKNCNIEGHSLYEGGFKDFTQDEKYTERNCLIHTDSECPCKILNEQSGLSKSEGGQSFSKTSNIYGEYSNNRTIKGCGFGDKGGASRFFYCAKASKSERNYGCEELEEKSRADINKIMGESANFKTGSGNDRTTKFSNHHPTVKPIKLMEYLVKLVTISNGLVLDPFVGSGTTAIACLKLQRRFVGIEKEKEYFDIAQARIKPYLTQKSIQSEVGNNE